MNVEKFLRFAISAYSEDVKKDDPNVDAVTFVKRCITLARQDIGDEEFKRSATKMAEDAADSARRQIDAVYWCRLATWSPEEAGCLAIGYDPDDIALVEHTDDDTYSHYIRIRRAAERYLSCSNDRAPAPLARHLARFGAEFPREILRRLKKEESYYSGWERKYYNLKDEQFGNADNKKSYLTLIYPYVVKRFKFDCKKRTGAVKKIRNDLKEEHGLSLTEKPIRKILEAAWEFANPQEGR